MVVSHDRWFLDRIATHVLAFEGDSQVRWFEGNFEAYESFRHEQLGAEADRPHRITYKKLVRGVGCRGRAVASKAVLITGCSIGIGHATAERLLADGWKVYATARRPETIADLEASGRDDARARRHRRGSR